MMTTAMLAPIADCCVISRRCGQRGGACSLSGDRKENVPLHSEAVDFRRLKLPGRPFLFAGCSRQHGSPVESLPEAAGQAPLEGADLHGCVPHCCTVLSGFEIQQLGISPACEHTQRDPGGCWRCDLSAAGGKERAGWTQWPEDFEDDDRWLLLCGPSDRRLVPSAGSSGTSQNQSGCSSEDAARPGRVCPLLPWLFSGCGGYAQWLVRGRELEQDQAGLQRYPDHQLLYLATCASYQLLLRPIALQAGCGSVCRHCLQLLPLLED